MQEKEYINYYLLRNKAYRITIPLTLVLGFIILLILELSFPYTKNWGTLGIVKYGLEIVIVMMATSLSGWMVGALIVFLIFETLTFTHGPQFHTFVLLILSLCSNIPMKEGWYRSLWKTILLFIGFTITMAAGTAFVGWIVNDFGNFWHDLWIYALPLLIVCILNYAYMNLVPEKIHGLFFASSFSSPKIRNIRIRLKKQKNRKSIGSQISCLIIFEAAFLIMCAYGWGGGIFLHAPHFFENHLESARAMTEFFVCMLMTSIPVMLLGIAYSNIAISNPLLLMSLAMQDAYKTMMEEACSIDDISIYDLKLDQENEIGVLYRCLVDSVDNVTTYLEQVKREQKLTNDLAAANAASKAKSSFLSNMSHEIRTPINAVLGLDEMILRECKDTDILSYARDIQNAGKSLLSLVNDILDFSKIEAGKMEIIPTEYDLSSTINDLVNMIAKRAEDKGLELVLNIDKTIPHLLFGDEVRLKQCAVNILTNAVKYTEKGSVTLSISSEKTAGDTISLTVKVADTGIGIKEADIERLFTAFQRLDEKRNRTIEGTGLGMNIVQQLLSLMGSVLHVESTYGKGSTFSFSVEQTVINWEPIGDFSQTYQKSQETTTEEHEAFHAPEAHVLVVDDTPLNLTVAKGLLRRIQMQVDTAESGAETLELVQKNRYDIIFLDHRMPQMDGLETFAAMASLEGNLNRGVPCIALTANAISGAREQYLKAGFNDYLTKPIDSRKLEKMLSTYLPPEKIVPVEEDSNEQTESAEAATEESLAIEGISTKDALQNCGGEDILCAALKDFYNAIDEKSAQIESFVQSGDLKNYTVLVHALKSSARLIGAQQLSKDAAHLELCGDAGDKHEIEEKTPALLVLYRSYKEKLQAFAPPKADTSVKEPMSMDSYKEALSGLKDCMEVADFDSADEIIAMMDDYAIPAEAVEQYEALKKHIAAVDRDSALKLL